MKKTVALILQIALTVPSGILGCYPPPKRSGSTCDKLQRHLVRRDQWCAREPSGPIDCMRGPAPYLIVHHTVSGACDDGDACSGEMRKLQEDHMSLKKWPDVGYHYVVGGDARAYAGRPCGLMGGHTKGHNRQSIGIAFLGDYQKTKPSREMLDLVPLIALCAVEQGYLRPDFAVIGHRDAFCSTCPGDALQEIVGRWPRYPDVVPIASYTCDRPATSTTSTTAETTTEAATSTTSTASTAAAPTTTEPPGSHPEVAGLSVYVYLLPCRKPPSCRLDLEARKDK